KGGRDRFTVASRKRLALLARTAARSQRLRQPQPVCRLLDPPVGAVRAAAGHARPHRLHLGGRLRLVPPRRPNLPARPWPGTPPPPPLPVAALPPPPARP